MKTINFLKTFLFLSMFMMGCFVSFANNIAVSNISIRVFTIELVYVPQGSFYAGSGGSETSAFYRFPATTDPFQFTTEQDIAMPSRVTQLAVMLRTIRMLHVII